MEYSDEENPGRKNSSTIWYDEHLHISEEDVSCSNRKSSLTVPQDLPVKIHRLSENLGLKADVLQLRERVSVPSLPSTVLVVPPTKSIKDAASSDGSKESILSPDAVTYSGVSPKPKRKAGAWRNPLARKKDHGSSPGLVQRLVPGRRRKVGTVKPPDITKLEAIIPDFVFIDPDLEKDALFEVG